jgi:lipopolysaccharide biosynthesis glycosyltransferase
VINIAIGYDPSETVAFWVLAHSIMKRSSEPVNIVPLNKRYLPMTRERNEMESTEFSFSRFLTPWLFGYRNDPAVFLDCDMLCLGDVAELVSSRVSYFSPVSVVKHHHLPVNATKMLGALQTQYECKNWSSVMVFYPSHHDCKYLTPKYVNSATGLTLHQFKWVQTGEVGEIPRQWNHLVGYDENKDSHEISLLHWTEGGPWWKDHQGAPYAELWYSEREDMLSSYERIKPK